MRPKRCCRPRLTRIDTNHHPLTWRLNMLLRKMLIAVGLVVVVCPPAFAQVKLERKVREGTTQTVEVSSRTEQKLTIAGMETDTSSDSKTVVKATIGKRD